MDSESKLRVRSALMFHTVLILLLPRFHTGEPVGQYQPVLASIGVSGFVTLPCHVDPATDAAGEMLEWSRPDLNPRFVHVRRDGEDHLVDQNPSYAGRTSVSVDGLKQGNMSLRLSRLRLSDEGMYRCFSPRLKTDSRVQLVVATVIEITRVGAGVLECKSAGWYPEPEVLWLDAEGNLLSAGPTETVRGPDDLYTVSSRVTVEKRHSNNFTCRVQQNNEHRDAKIHVPDDFFVDPSANSAVPAVIAVTLFVLAVLAFAWFAWKQRQNKTKAKTSREVEESQNGNETNSKSQSDDSERATLMNQNKVEEESNTTGPEEDQKMLNNDQQQSDKQPVKAGTEFESKQKQNFAKTQNAGESGTHEEQQDNNVWRSNEEGASLTDPKVDGEQTQQGAREEGSKINKSDINSNNQSESQEEPKPSPGKHQEPGKLQEAQPQEEAGTPKEHLNNVGREDGENRSPSIQAETGDQRLTNEKMKDKTTKNSDTAVETLKDHLVANLKTESEETPSPRPADVDSETDEQPVNTKIPESNPKDEEEANKDTANGGNEDETQATYNGTAV